MSPRVWVRFLAFACLTVVPFWHFVLVNDYSLLTSEALAATLLFCIPSVVLALVARGRWFYPVLFLCAMVVAVDPFERLTRTAHTINPWLAAVVLAGLLIGAIATLRRHTAVVLMVFAASFLGADLFTLYAARPASIGSAAGPKPQHVLYIVLDEHLGINGFPLDCEACRKAQQVVLETFQRHLFTIYPNAFSNYDVTLDSVPSILNRQLLKSSGEFSSGRTPGGAVVIAPNRMFSDFGRQAYRIAVYQHRSIDYAAGDYAAGIPHVDRARSYSDVLGGLQAVPGWPRRFLWLIGDYQGSDPLLSKARAFLPFRAGYRSTGPLAVRSVWPGTLAADINQARGKTLFFVHLLMPHEPYVYRADGTVRDFAEWHWVKPGDRLDAPAYTEQYQRYCWQVSVLSHQLDGLLSSLEHSGALASMTVVIHGDHGSRILRKQEGAAPLPPDARTDDISGPPTTEDLVNRFSTLLAIRKPGAVAASVMPENRSVLSFLTADFYHDGGAAVPGANSVYLSDAQGTFREISMTKIWR
jgi:hypothetical protein